MPEDKRKKKQAQKNSKPISLYPLEFKEALVALLATKPPQKKERQEGKGEGGKPSQAD